MNKTRKNVVIVGFLDEAERRSVSIPFIDGGNIHYVSNLSEATKFQGYMILIDNRDNIDLVELDKKYRKTFNRFELIYIYNEKYKERYYKYSRFKTWNREIFCDLSYEFACDWDDYKKIKENSIKTKYNKNKETKLNMLYNFIKDKKEITTKEIKKILGISERNIQRYMEDINNIYHNVGYDYSNNEWYFIW